MKIESIFYQLLQVAIGNRKELSHTPSKSEWKELFELSKKQALTAVAMAGVTKLKQSCIIKGSDPLMIQVLHSPSVNSRANERRI